MEDRPADDIDVSERLREQLRRTSSWRVGVIK
jgi:hypothetical protein